MANPGVVESQKENVLIHAGNCHVTVLPNLGGKIASIRVNHHELLQAPLAPLAPRTPTMAFDSADASGWDECLPSVAASTVSTESGPVSIPDHGDLWRVAWDIADSNETSITLLGRCFSLPLTLERTLAVTETGHGWQLRLGYVLTNTGRSPVPWSWSAHPLFAVDPDDEIELPPSIHQLRLEGSYRNRLGSNGDTVQWPIAPLADGSRADLRIVQSLRSEIGDKLFAGPLASHESECTLLRKKAGLRIRFGFDPALTPYLGLWICYGGWPEHPGPKQMCVAPEPATAPVDSLAKSGPWSQLLLAGARAHWTMSTNIEII